MSESYLEYTIFCLCIDDGVPAGPPFIIKIPCNKSVYALKSSIADALKDSILAKKLDIKIVAYDLTLWKFKEPLSWENVGSSLQNIQLDESVEELYPLKTLSNCWATGDLKEGHVHVVVQLPPPDSHRIVFINGDKIPKVIGTMSISVRHGMYIHQLWQPIKAEMNLSYNPTNVKPLPFYLLPKAHPVPQEGTKLTYFSRDEIDTDWSLDRPRRLDVNEKVQDEWKRDRSCFRLVVQIYVQLRVACLDHQQVLIGGPFTLSLSPYSSDGRATQVWYLLQQIKKEVSTLPPGRLYVQKLQGDGISLDILKSKYSVSSSTRQPARIRGRFLDEDEALINHFEGYTAGDFLKVVVRTPPGSSPPTSIGVKRGIDNIDDDPNNASDYEKGVLERRWETFELIEDIETDHPRAIEDLYKLVVLGGRPYGYFGYPTIIYDKSLATFHATLDSLDAAVQSGMQNANFGLHREHLEFIQTFSTGGLLELYQGMFNFFQDECARLDCWRSILKFTFRSDMGSHIVQYDHSENGLKADVTVTAPEQPDNPYVLIEFQNEEGSGGDPIPQAIRYYSDVISRKSKSYRSGVFPAVVVGVSGARLRIWTVLVTDRIHCSQALDWSMLGSGNLSGFSKFCRILYALRTCAGMLKDEYASENSPTPESRLELPCTQPSDDSFRLNYKCRLRDGVCLPLKRRLDAYVPDKDLFVADMVTHSSEGQSETREVVVKFTYRYNKDAHEVVAAENLAPKLHWCASIPGGQGLKMVVMDRIEGKMMSHFRQYTLYYRFFERLWKALKVLHEKDYVFGDFRAPNIMVVVEGDEQRPKLIDFDWAAKDSEGLYPPNIEMRRIGPFGWAKGVGALAPMLKEHDVEAFEVLKEHFEGSGATRY